MTIKELCEYLEKRLSEMPEGLANEYMSDILKAAHGPTKQPHWSDCALLNAPAHAPDLCDCGVEPETWEAA